MQKNFGKSREEFEAILEHLPDAEREGFRRMGEMFKPWETLHPELALYLYEDHMGTHLKHPLVFDVMYCPGLRDGMLNEQYEAKSKAVAEYRAEGKWSSFVFMHERPYRLDALMKIQDEIADDCEFWDLVSGVWTDTENARQNYEEWDDLFSSGRSCRESMMNDAEREVLAGLPKEFVIPGQNRIAALCDLARTVIRRAERLAINAAAPDSLVVPYLNRMSSLLWAMGRWQEAGGRGALRSRTATGGAN